MKTGWRQLIYLSLLSLLMTAQAFAFTSGSTGALGAFNPTSHTTVQLPPDGILNYTTINIPAGVSVSFAKNATNTPVYMLATGNVTIAGIVNVSGSAANIMTPGKGGPGGFDGGIGALIGSCGGAGLGPGGGKIGTLGYCNYAYWGSQGGNGGFGNAGYAGAAGSCGSSANPGGAGGAAYGNASLSSLIGGSGGGGGCGGTYSVGGTGGAGGGGGGALLIASSGTITVSGTIYANGGGGGAGGTYGSYGGGGAGGAIKLMANVIDGNGPLQATGADTISNGRIRLEATTLTRTSGTTPAYSYSSSPSSVFPQNLPSLSISGIGGSSAPSSPAGNYSSPDIVLPVGTTNPVNITVQASNIPVSTSVSLTIQPQAGAASTTTAVLAGTDQLSSATASASLSTTLPSVIIASATFTLLASNDMPVFAGGERVIQMEVSAAFGGRSSITYITESGKRVPADI